MQHLEICGNIASGKTTLASVLKQAGIDPIFEQFQENPFWEAFYQDPVKNSFETEITFLLQHYHAIKIALTQNTAFACDYSITLDKAYADVTLTEERRRIFSSVADEAIKEIGNPSKLIFLQCPETILIERIKARSRDAEKAINIDYLKQISKALAKRVETISRKVDVIKIDSHKLNFVTNVEDTKTVLALIS